MVGSVGRVGHHYAITTTVSVTITTIAITITMSVTITTITRLFSVNTIFLTTIRHHVVGATT